MRTLQHRLVSDLAGEPLLVYLLEDLLSYDAYDETGDITLMVEQFEQEQATIYIFRESRLLDVCDLVYSDLERDIEEIMMVNYSIHLGFRKGVLPTVGFVSAISRGVFLVRDRELTRGGELVELCYLVFGRISNLNLLFLRREGIAVSSMVEEVLSTYDVPFANFRDEADLHEKGLEQISRWLQAG